jgi:nucleoside-diphosphate-sugar epimerase
MEGKPLVVITGISGYLGSHVCLLFLKHGGYRVRGTVRDTKNPEKMDPLRKAFGEHFDQLELVEADLLDAQSLMRAMEGAEYLIHTASPFPMGEPAHEDIIIKPAVEGTMAALTAAAKNRVKRVVLTSSVAAIMDTADKSQRNFTPDDWSVT